MYLVVCVLTRITLQKQNLENDANIDCTNFFLIHDADRDVKSLLNQGETDTFSFNSDINSLRVSQKDLTKLSNSCVVTSTDYCLRHAVMPQLP